MWCASGALCFKVLMHSLKEIASQTDQYLVNLVFEEKLTKIMFLKTKWPSISQFDYLFLSMTESHIWSQFGLHMPPDLHVMCITCTMFQISGCIHWKKSVWLAISFCVLLFTHRSFMIESQIWSQFGWIVISPPSCTIFARAKFRNTSFAMKFIFSSSTCSMKISRIGFSFARASCISSRQYALAQ